MSSRACQRAARRAGLVALACSLLGWSAWWGACNVYGLAPRLPVWPLAAAWLLAVAVPLLARGCWLPWALVALNGAYLLALHRGWGLPPANAALWLAASLLLASAGRGGAGKRAAASAAAA